MKTIEMFKKDRYEYLYKLTVAIEKRQNFIKGINEHITFMKKKDNLFWDDKRLNKWILTNKRYERQLLGLNRIYSIIRNDNTSNPIIIKL